MAREMLGSPSLMPRPRHSARGFTLIELAVVVVIVGVLSVIAIVAYRKIVLSAKVGEARQMIGAIVIAQEEHYSERRTYVNIGPTYCPSDGTQYKKYGWDTACAPGWASLPVHADNAVQFGYTTFAGTTVAQPPGVSNTLIDVGGYNGKAMPYFVVHAKAELDNPANGVFTELAGSSFDKEIRQINVGE